MVRLFHKSSIFDHSPLLLHFLNKLKKGKKKKLFRFESMWLGDARCEQVVSEVWSEGLSSTSNFLIVQCLEECRMKLEAWNKTEFGYVGVKIAQL